MTAPSLPTMRPFEYILIPTEESQPAQTCRFDGKSEDDLRHTLTRHFRRSLLSADQKTSMARHIAGQIHEGNQKRGTTESESSPEAQQRQEELVDQFLDQASYEIVPVTMPGRTNGFIGTSLYVDDSGTFKDLAVNPRASRIAQREIRGDAFLLSNHDDPALDEWGRIDCPLTTFESLLAAPPQTSYDANNRAQMAKEALAREGDTKVISAEDVQHAVEAKAEGNRLVAEQNWKAAVVAYSTAIRLTEGRRDLLENEGEVTTLHISALLNRSLSNLREHHCDDAAKDARAALVLDASSIKGYYRLAQALIADRDYDGASVAVDELAQRQGQTEEVASMRVAIADGAAKQRAAEKKKFSKMFA